MSTGESIDPEYWDEKKQRPKQNYRYYSRLKRNLDKMERDVENFRLDLIDKGVRPTREHFKEAFRAERAVTYAEAKEAFIEWMGVNRSERTVAKFLTTFRALERYKRPSFTMFNKTFGEDFSTHLYGKGLVNNSVGKYVSNVKTFLSFCYDRGWITTDYWRKYKILQEEADITYLTKEELHALETVELPETLDKVRGLFLFGCYTGLRFSDLSRFDKNWIKNGEIVVHMEKTRRPVRIPVLPQAQKLIDKGLQKMVSQVANRGIKEACKIAGINDQVIKTRYSAAKKVEIKKPKHEVISFHDARRTFIILSLEGGTRPEVLMDITGHKSYKDFKKYIKIVPKVRDFELNVAWKKVSSS